MGIAKLQFDPPRDWEDFEDLCLHLWTRIWHDENVQKHGRRGQPQAGVDVYGQPNQGKEWAGVQCKGKSNYVHTALTKSELRAEVEKAMKWRAGDAKLTLFIVATTGPRDGEIQALAREITEEHRSAGLFSVVVFSWDDILLKLEEHPDAGNQFLAGHGLSRLTITRASGIPWGEPQGIHEKLDILISRPGTMGPLLPPEELRSEYKAQLDEIKKMLVAMKPVSAKELTAGLKSRAWGKLGVAEKYRLSVQEAAAAWQEGDDKCAGKLLIEALEFKPDDDKALANCALGYLMLGREEKAVARARQAIAKNKENCTAHGILVQASADDKGIDELAAAVPEACREKPSVAYGMAHVARRRGMLGDAVRWLRLAIANDPDGSPDLKADLGQTLLEMATGVEHLGAAQASGALSTNLFDEARQCYEEACAQVRHTEVHRYRSAWFANLANARWMTNDLDGAVQAIGDALESGSGNAKYIKIKAAIEQERGRKDEAVRLLEGIRSNPETPEVAVLLALLKGEDSKQAEAIAVLDEFLAGEPSEPLRTDALLFRARFLAEAGDAEEAMAVVDAVTSDQGVAVHSMVFAAQVADLAGEAPVAQELMASALQKVQDDMSVRDVMSLAEALARRKQFSEAVEVYERLGANDPGSPLAVHLLQCCYFAGELDKALDLCKALGEKHGIQRRVSAMAPAILDEIGDLPGAARGYEEYLAKFPDDLEPKFQLAHVNLRMENLEAVDAFLAEPPSTGELTYEAGNNLALLYQERGEHHRALDIMYEMRRKFYDNPQAHLGYWGVWMRMIQAQADGWLGEVQTGGVGAAVHVDDQGGDKTWYIIEDRRGADISKGELTPDHPIAKALSGRKAGDEVILADDGVSKTTAKVLEVKSKYVWALNDTGVKFQSLFPGKPGLWRFHVDTTGDRDKLRESLKPVLDQVRGRQEQVRQVEELYQRRVFTVGACANALSEHPLDVWGRLTGSSEFGLVAFQGDTSLAVKDGQKLLASSKGLVADVLALATLHTLELADEVVTRVGRLGVTQSTVEQLRAALVQNRARSQKGLQMMGAVRDAPVFDEIPAQYFERNVKLLETTLSWVERNCDILPVSGALQVRRERRQELSKMLGASFVDTVLVAWGDGRLLYSDDERLRNLAGHEYGVQGVWTQALLAICLGEGRISEETYQDAVIGLMSLRYRHTWFNADTLLVAARKANWRLQPPFSSVVAEASDKSITLQSLASVVADFLFVLGKEGIQAVTEGAFASGLLEAVVKRREPRAFADTLRRHLQQRFGREHAVRVATIESHVDAWLRARSDLRR